MPCFHATAKMTSKTGNRHGNECIGVPLVLRLQRMSERKKGV